MDEGIRKEYFEELSIELPKLIIINPGGIDEYITKFLKDNNYKLLKVVVQDGNKNRNIYSHVLK